MKRGFIGVFLGIAALLAALAPVELRLRTKRGPPAAEGWPEFDYFYSEIYDDFFRPVLNDDWTLSYKAARSRAASQSFLARKRPGVVRIFVVGGSVAIPFAEENVTRFKELAGRLLPGREIEVIGCGMGGYDSFRDEMVFREVLRRQPDAVVLMSGNNEYFDPRMPSPTLEHLTRRLRRLWLFRLPLDRLHSSAPKRRATLKDRAVAFESNLRLMAGAARAKKVPLIFCTLPANVLDMPPLRFRVFYPGRNYWDALAEFDSGQDRLAAKKLEIYVRAHPRDAYGHYWLARALDRGGRFDRAREHYLRAVDLDDPGERCSAERNAVIRRVANETGMIAADLEKTFNELSERGLPDGRIFIDPMHWRKEYYPLVSWTILRAIYEAASGAGSFLAPADRWQWGELDALQRDIFKPVFSEEAIKSYGEQSVYKAMSYVLWADGKMSDGALALFDSELVRDPETFKFLTRTIENVRPAFRSNSWLQAHEKQLPLRWNDIIVHVGEVYRRRKRYVEALADFDAVLANDPHHDRALFLRAQTLSALGRTAEARKSLAGASEAFRRTPWHAYWRSRLGVAP